MFLTTFTKSYLSLLLLFLSQYVIRYDHYSYSYSLFDGLIKSFTKIFLFSFSLQWSHKNIKPLSDVSTIS
ncbi:TPA_asm: hypothetical protein [Vaccinia virus]|nr:TPA_asm: hypothetical protein [Vaccinia virus]DAD53111.1 TPA_asm: hypothetical protein [Vaccinia virus]DAD53347.1 TPA_asm: hypothetical protein [Vaccinia virus]DAD53584.1 TPA_asm: hypothetical protein [Vaccinia virus]DAD53823.1 TPA_asm: hypothetical protein [Vaccinia virus]